MFKPFLKTNIAIRQSIFIKYYENIFFIIFINDYLTAKNNFNNFFEFFYIKYFPRCVFRPIYFNEKKNGNILKYFKNN